MPGLQRKPLKVHQGAGLSHTECRTLACYVVRLQRQEEVAAMARLPLEQWLFSVD